MKEHWSRAPEPVAYITQRRYVQNNAWISFSDHVQTFRFPANMDHAISLPISTASKTDSCEEAEEGVEKTRSSPL